MQQPITAVQKIATRVGARSVGDAGQATAEYALVLLGAAADRAAHRHLGDIGWRRRQGRRPPRRRVLVDQEEHLVTPRRGDGGQATVELALVLPVFVMLLLLLVQVGVLVRDQVLVIHAAREGKRAAAVTGASADAAEKAALAVVGLPLRTTDVITTPPGPKHDLVQVQVHYTDSTDIPIIGRLLGDVQVTGTVSMRMEPG